jgi:hypothetical protein
MVDKPQAKRIQMMERQAEEMKRVHEARAREAAADSQARAKRLRQEAMNQRCYDTCAPFWREVKAWASKNELTLGMSVADSEEAQRRMDLSKLAKRLTHRAELRWACQLLCSAPTVSSVPFDWSVLLMRFLSSPLHAQLRPS